MDEEEAKRVLGLPEGADRAAIAEAYRRLAAGELGRRPLRPFFAAVFVIALGWVAAWFAAVRMAPAGPAASPAALSASAAPYVPPAAPAFPSSPAPGHGFGAAPTANPWAILPPGARVPLIASTGGGYGRSSSVISAEFSSGGTVPGTEITFPVEARQLAVDLRHATGYLLGSHQVFRVGPGPSTPIELRPDPGLSEPMSWPVGIAFDSRRRRVVIATLGGEGFLYAHEPDTGRWAILGSLRGVDLEGLVYDPTRDVLYGLSGGARLHRFSPDGLAQGVTLVPGAPPGGGGPSSRVQMASVYGKLLLVYPPPGALGSIAASRWLLIDPQSPWGGAPVREFSAVRPIP